MTLTNHYLVNPDLTGETFYLRGSSTSVLLFHGFTATTNEVRGLADYIHKKTKYSVYCPLLPGHGTNPVDLAKTDHQEWIDSAEFVYRQFEKDSDLIIVGGESMGGLLAIHLASAHPKISRLLLYAPALIIPGLSMARLFQNFIFSSPKSNIESPTEIGCLPWQGYKVNPLKAVVQLGKLQSIVRKELAGINCPTVIFQGELDNTINPVGSQQIFQSISSSRKNLVTLKNSGHCVLLEKEYPNVYAETVKFLQKL